MSVFSGRVNTIVYENEDFKILKVLLDESDSTFPMTVKGNFYGKVSIGDWISFEAKWHKDPKYGKQLSVERYPSPKVDWTNERIFSALSAQGVSMYIRSVLEMYVDRLDTSLFDMLNSGDLTAITKLDTDIQEYIVSRWRFIRAHLETSTFLYDLGLPDKVISNVWNTLGSDVEDFITDDPWMLVTSTGLSFTQADQIAKKLGVTLQNSKRVKGAVLSVVKEKTSQGDVYITLDNLSVGVSSLLRQVPTKEELSEAIRLLVDTKKVVVHRNTHNVICVYLKHNYDMETYCADQLVKRLQSPIDEKEYKEHLKDVGFVVDTKIQEGCSLNQVITSAVDNWCNGNSITLTDKQKNSCVDILTSKVSILTGLPGTGKTTTLQCVVNILKDASVDFLLVAPTGIAAKRLGSVTGCEAMTVHRAFGAKGKINDGEEDQFTYTGVIKTGKKSGFEESLKQEWGYGVDNKYPTKFVIIDESSMLDTHMLYRLLLSTAEDCSVIFVGDPFQLPSVGSGDVLRDLVKSDVFTHNHLQDIFRQKNTSGIVLAAHDTHHGVKPSLDNKDFVLFQSDYEGDTQQKIVQIAKKLFNSRYNFQVLSPRHKGEAGVTALNEVLRQNLNPPSSSTTQLKLGMSVIREGDRIMAIRNDYTRGIYNGDIGTVSFIDRKAKQIEVRIHDTLDAHQTSLVRFTFKEAGNILRLAYAQTVHKSQGQEYDIIVLPMLNTFTIQLQRNLFYTAITRAKKKVFIVGQESAMLKAIQNDQANKRYTLLNEHILKVLQDTTKE